MTECAKAYSTSDTSFRVVRACPLSLNLQYIIHRICFDISHINTRLHGIALHNTFHHLKRQVSLHANTRVMTTHRIKPQFYVPLARYPLSESTILSGQLGQGKPTREGLLSIAYTTHSIAKGGQIRLQSSVGIPNSSCYFVQTCHSLLTVRTLLPDTPALLVALLNAVHLYIPLSVAIAPMICRVVVTEGVVMDFLSVPLKCHFQVGVGLAPEEVHVNVTWVFSSTSKDGEDVGPETVGATARKLKQTILQHEQFPLSCQLQKGGAHQ